MTCRQIARRQYIIPPVLGDTPLVAVEPPLLPEIAQDDGTKRVVNQHTGQVVPSRGCATCQQHVHEENDDKVQHLELADEAKAQKKIWSDHKKRKAAEEDQKDTEAEKKKTKTG